MDTPLEAQRGDVGGGEIGAKGGESGEFLLFDI